jgi:hypothetical protein
MKEPCYCGAYDCIPCRGAEAVAHYLATHCCGDPLPESGVCGCCGEEEDDRDDGDDYADWAMDAAKDRMLELRWEGGES